MKKVAVLGLGRIGKIHLKNLVEYGTEVAPVAITSSQEGKAFAQSLAISEIYQNLEEAVSKEDIDAYVLCSPSDTHYAYTKLLIEAGKDIFCEKPLDLSISRIAELDALAKERSVKLLVAFNRRFDPGFTKLQQAIAGGKIGEPHVLKITSRDPGPPPLEFVAHSGGIFLDMIIHDFDMARFLLDDEVEEIYAKGDVNIDPAIKEFDDYDTAVSILTFKKGTKVIIDNSRKATYGYDQRIEVFGEKGMLKVDNQFPDMLQFYDQGGGRYPQSYDFFIDRYSQSYKFELDHFLRAILDDTEISVTAYDAQKATQIGLAAMKSVKTNKPVKIDDIG